VVFGWDFLRGFLGFFALRPREAARSRLQLNDARDIAKANRALVILFVIGQENAAFAGGRELVALEAEDRNVANATTGDPAPDRAVGVRRIFNDLKPMTFGQRLYLGHLAGHAPQMHNHNRLGPCGNSAGNIHRIRSEAVRLALAKNRNQAKPQHRQGISTKRGARDNHLGTGLKIERKKSSQQRTRAVVVGERKAPAGEPEVIPLKLLGDRVGGNVSVAHDLEHGGLVLAGQKGPAQRPALLQRDRGLAAKNGRTVDGK